MKARFLLYGSIVFVLTTGCNSLLGISSDIAEYIPDATRPSACYLDSNIAQISSSSTSKLVLGTPDYPTSPQLRLNVHAGSDFYLRLSDNVGGARVVNAAGTHKLQDADSRNENCGICIRVEDSYVIQPDVVLQEYFTVADPNVALVLTRADSTGLTGEIDNLTLRHIDYSNYEANITTSVGDNCDVTVDRVTFDLPYSTGSLTP